MKTVTIDFFKDFFAQLYADQQEFYDILIWKKKEDLQNFLRFSVLPEFRSREYWFWTERIDIQRLPESFFFSGTFSPSPEPFSGVLNSDKTLNLQKFYRSSFIESIECYRTSNIKKISYHELDQLHKGMAVEPVGSKNFQTWTRSNKFFLNPDPDGPDCSIYCKFRLYKIFNEIFQSGSVIGTEEWSPVLMFCIPSVLHT